MALAKDWIIKFHGDWVNQWLLVMMAKWWEIHGKEQKNEREEQTSKRENESHREGKGAVE